MARYNQYSSYKENLFHIFAPIEVNGCYPVHSGIGPIYAFPENHPKSSKNHAWEYISSTCKKAGINVNSVANSYHYHGLFKGDKFIKIDESVKKSWINGRIASKFSI